jgi:hypothetical protein
MFMADIFDTFHRSNYTHHNFNNLVVSFFGWQRKGILLLWTFSQSQSQNKDYPMAWIKKINRSEIL